MLRKFGTLTRAKRPKSGELETSLVPPSSAQYFHVVKGHTWNYCAEEGEPGDEATLNYSVHVYNVCSTVLCVSVSSRQRDKGGTHSLISKGPVTTSKEVAQCKVAQDPLGVVLA